MAFFHEKACFSLTYNYLKPFFPPGPIFSNNDCASDAVAQAIIPLKEELPS
ncbi:hypothetical protein [Arcticibacter tournemirensis]